MRVHLGRVAALAALLFVHADSGVRASEDMGCKTCTGSGPGTTCSDAGPGDSGWTGCQVHFDTSHGWHCDFSGDRCTIPS